MTTFTWKSPSRPSLKLKVMLDDVEFYEYSFKRYGYDGGIIPNKEYIQEQLDEWDEQEITEELLATGAWNQEKLNSSGINDLRLFHIAMLDIYNNMSHYEDKAE